MYCSDTSKVLPCTRNRRHIQIRSPQRLPLRKNLIFGVGLRPLCTKNPLAESFDLHPLDRLGHHPDYPVNHNWGNLVEELLSYLPDTDEPLLGVGHSLGGTLMAMAAD